jgi:hypothetical protein
MFDDLREEATAVPEVEQPKPKPVEKPAPAAVAPKPRKRSKKIFGLTGPQRFMVSAMLMSMVCMTGFMFLFVMGKIGF